MSTRLVLNSILAWGFYCAFTICPKDERTLLKDVWMFCCQIVQIKELLCAVLEMLWVLKFSEHAVVIIPTCWYQELLPYRDQGTADWWYHVFKDNPLHWAQNQVFTLQAVPVLHFRYGILCTLLLANFWSFRFFCQKVKKPQNKTKSTTKKAHNIKNYIFKSSKWLKTPASPDKSTRQSVECILRAERAADTAHDVIVAWRDPGQTPTEKLRELQFHSDCS